MKQQAHSRPIMSHQPILGDCDPTIVAKSSSKGSVFNCSGPLSCPFMFLYVLIEMVRIYDNVNAE